MNIRRNGVVCAFADGHEYNPTGIVDRLHVKPRCLNDEAEIIFVWDLTEEPVSCLSCIAEGSKK